jgi:hypothetical protein
VVVVDLQVMDVNELVQAVSSGLSPLVVEDVADEGEWILVRARTSLATAVCLVCGASSERVHGYRWRTVADVPIDSHGSCSSDVCAGRRLAGRIAGTGTATVIMNVCDDVSGSGGRGGHDSPGCLGPVVPGSDGRDRGLLRTA